MGGIYIFVYIILILVTIFENYITGFQYSIIFVETPLKISNKICFIPLPGEELSTFYSI